MKSIDPINQTIDPINQINEINRSNQSNQSIQSIKQSVKINQSIIHNSNRSPIDKIDQVMDKNQSISYLQFQSVGVHLWQFLHQRTRVSVCTRSGHLWGRVNLEKNKDVQQNYTYFSAVTICHFRRDNIMFHVKQKWYMWERELIG